MSSLVPGSTLCGHVLKDKLGEGAFGEVWKVVRVNDNRLLAIKILFQEHLNRKQVVDRFIQEFAILQSIRHGNIVEVYDLLHDGEVLGMSMELVQGKPLSYAIEKRKQFPPAEAIGILQNILHALAYAHRLGVIHRDIKPANVMITASAEVKLTDFGIAKTLHSSSNAIRTRTGFALGTPFYMAPEIIIGVRDLTDHRLDIYSSGCILYELLTGQPPYFEAMQTENPEFFIQHAHVQLAPPDPRLLNAYVPDELAAVCAMAMAKDPRERFQDCRQFIAVLQRVLDRMEDGNRPVRRYAPRPKAQAPVSAPAPAPVKAPEPPATSTKDSISWVWSWVFAFIVGFIVYTILKAC